MSYQTEVINPGDEASRLAHSVCVGSFENSNAVSIVPMQRGNFRGPVGFLWKPYILRDMYRTIRNRNLEPVDWQVLEMVQNDGAGGKPQFFTLLDQEEQFRQLGWEIITMCADDLARTGALPVIIDNEVNAKSITEANLPYFAAMMDGYGEALKQSRLVNITGETAVMRHQITAFCDQNADSQLIITWGASCIGLLRRETYVDTRSIKPGMPIVGFADPGYRCNGGTFFTKLLLAKFRNVGEIAAHPVGLTMLKELTVPSLSYARTITRALGWNDDGTTTERRAKICGIAHITGGGVWGKFREILPEGVGAVLSDMPDPPQVLIDAQAMSLGTHLALSDLLAYGTFHGGCGMLIVCDTLAAAERLLKEAQQDSIRALIVGTTTQSADNEVIITSRFHERRELSSREYDATQ